MDQVIYKILTLLGLPSSVALTLSGNYFLGIFVIIILGGLWIARLFGPTIMRLYKEKKQNTESVVSGISDMSDKLDSLNFNLSDLVQHMKDSRSYSQNKHMEFQSNIEVFKNDLNSIKSKLSTIEVLATEAVSDSVNKLDDTASIRWFLEYQAKISKLAMAFFRLRLSKNHIEGNEDKVLGRYLREADKLGGKLAGVWRGVTAISNGLPIGSFWGSDEEHEWSAVFMRQIMIELYSMQLAKHRDGHDVPNDEDLTQMFERLESSAVQSFKIWLHSGKDWGRQKADGILPDMRLDRPLGEVDFVQEVLNDKRD